METIGDRIKVLLIEYMRYTAYLLNPTLVPPNYGYSVEILTRHETVYAQKRGDRARMMLLMTLFSPTYTRKVCGR